MRTWCSRTTRSKDRCSQAPRSNLSPARPSSSIFLGAQVTSARRSMPTVRSTGASTTFTSRPRIPATRSRAGRQARAFTRPISSSPPRRSARRCPTSFAWRRARSTARSTRSASCTIRSRRLRQAGVIRLPTGTSASSTPSAAAASAAGIVKAPRLAGSPTTSCCQTATRSLLPRSTFSAITATTSPRPSRWRW